MDKLKVLKSLSFGRRIAEEEADQLSRYFLETDQFRALFDDERDIVYGAKGAGKSALYFALKNDENKLFERGVILLPGENPRGSAAFSDLVSDPPVGEREFIALWKFYIASLVGSSLRDNGIKNESAKFVVDKLEQALLIRKKATLSALIRSALDYARRIVNFESIATTMEIDPLTGLPSGFSGKITLKEPSANQRDLGLISIDDLLRKADEALQQTDFSLWICLDRLDVAFAESLELEANALRALFKVYLDFQVFNKIKLKIFLRSDIWERIIVDGFRESSHITRGTNISWNSADLLNLVIRRITQSEAICSFYQVNPTAVASSFNLQDTLFYKIFPDRVNSGDNQSKTFDWIRSRTSDATGLSAPREILHLLDHARELQIKKLEQGHQPPPGTILFDKLTLKEALAEVSKVRLEQTIYPEYPDTKKLISAFQGEKAVQSLDTLCVIWKSEKNATLKNIKRLIDIGFLSQTGTKDNPRYQVPFLYRSHLDITQGKAGEMEGDEANEH